MVSRTLRQTGLAGVLLASTALVAPNMALAADAVIGDVDFTKGLTAPVVNNLFTIAPGTRVRIETTVETANPAQVDVFTPLLLLYNGGTFAGSVVGTPTAGGGVAGATLDLTWTLPTSGFDQVIFAAVPTDDEAGGGTADDTIDSVAAAAALVVFTPSDDNADGVINRGEFTATVVDLSAGTDNSHGGDALTPADRIAIGGDENVNVADNRVSLNNLTYQGPVLIAAGRDGGAGTPNFARLTFNAFMADPGDDVDIAGLAFESGTNTDAAVRTDTSATTAPVAFTAPTAEIFFDSFTLAVDNVDIIASVLEDEAGNSNVAVTDFPIAPFAPPAYAGTGETHIVTNVPVLFTDPLFSEDGFVSSVAGSVAVVSVRFAEAIDNATLDPADFQVTGHDGLSVSAVGGGGTSTITVTVDSDGTPAGYRFDAASGVLETTIDVGLGVVNPGATWTPVTVRAVVDAVTPLETTIGTVLTTNLAAVDAVAGVAPSVLLLTLDDDFSGVLDGGQFDFIAPLASPLPGTTGVTIGNANDPAATRVPPTVSLDAADPAVLKAVVAESVLEGFLVAPQTVADNLNTGSTGADLPYNVEISGSEITYASIFDVADGELLTIADFAAAQPPLDGAPPVLTGAVLLLPPATSSAEEGALRLEFSEAMLASGSTNFIATPGGTLALDLLNAGEDSVVAGDFDVDNTDITISNLAVDVLQSFNVGSGVGITASNRTGGFGLPNGRFEGADNNVVGPQAVTPTTGVLAPPVAFDGLGATVLSADNSRITNILLFADEPLGSEVGTGADLADIFTVDLGATLTGIVPDSVVLNGNVVNLAMPGAGIDLRQIDERSVLTITANYTPTAETFLHEAGSADNPVPGGPVNVQPPETTLNVFTMDLRGRMVLAGSPAESSDVLEQGSIVRADVVAFTESKDVIQDTKDVSVTVPCDCGTSGTSTIAVLGGIPGGVVAALNDPDNARRATAFLEVTQENDATGNEQVGLSAQVLAGHPGAAIGRAVYQVTVNATARTGAGRITSTDRRVTGTFTFETGPDGNGNDLVLETASTSYGIVDDDGNYRVTVGVEENLPGAFLSVAVKRPNEDWVLVSSADPTFLNHIPFRTDGSFNPVGRAPHLQDDEFPVLGGLNSNGVFNMRLDAIETTKLRPVGGTAGSAWQLVGFPGTLARTPRTDAFTTYRLLTTIRQFDGAPWAIWGQSLTGLPGGATLTGVEDESFVLKGNQVRTDFELDGIQVQTIGRNFGTSDGLAVRLGTQSSGLVFPDFTDTLFYMVDPTTDVSGSVPRGWSLITAPEDEDLADLESSDGIQMIIEAGGGLQARTWILGAEGNLLSRLERGKAYFVYTPSGFTLD